MILNKLSPNTIRLCCLAILLAVLSITAQATERGPLLVGAAKVDITPHDLKSLTNLWGNEFEGIHDKIFVRALVLDNSKTTVVIVAADLVEFGDTMDVRNRIAQEAGIPLRNIVLSATHDHSAPQGGKLSPGAIAKPWSAAKIAYSKFVDERILEAVREAKVKLQPAKVGVSTGSADININRDELTQQGWKLGVNPNRPSDKTVWVVKFETVAGEPIALLVNYAVHSAVMGPENKLISGDLAGATSGYIEQHFDNKVVALFTSGAAGDQNPKFMTWDTTFTNKTLRPGFSLVDSQSQILAEEALRTASHIQHELGDVRMMAAQKILSCPAKVDPNARVQSGVSPAKDVDIDLGLVMINRIALATVSGEVVTNIYWHLKKDSPFTDTMMVTLVNGRVGYLVDDVAYETPFFEVSGTPVARNCAETGIGNGVLEMMKQF